MWRRATDDTEKHGTVFGVYGGVRCVAQNHFNERSVNERVKLCLYSVAKFLIEVGEADRG